MKIIEILELNRGLLRICGRLGVKTDDVEYIDLFNDYNEMVAKGEKVSYAVAVVAERYGVCERKVYSLVKRFNSECNRLIFNKGGGKRHPLKDNGLEAYYLRCTSLAA